MASPTGVARFLCSIAMLWFVCFWSEGLSSACGSRVTYLLRGQEISNQQRRPPRLALVGHPAQQVREPGPGFSTAHPCAVEKEPTSRRFPLRGLSTPTHRRTGAPGRAARHPGAHSVRNRCAVARANGAVPGEVRSEIAVGHRPGAETMDGAISFLPWPLLPRAFCPQVRNLHRSGVGAHREAEIQIHCVWFAVVRSHW